MKVAYVSGPYRADTPAQILRNIGAAATVAKQLWNEGYAVICPHKNTALFDGDAPDEVWLKGDLEFVKRSDMVVAMTGWENSEGAIAELKYAIEHNVSIVRRCIGNWDYATKRGNKDHWEVFTPEFPKPPLTVVPGKTTRKKK